MQYNILMQVYLSFCWQVQLYVVSPPEISRASIFVHIWKDVNLYLNFVLNVWHSSNSCDINFFKPR